jgi:uncharacterized glyoxalase superfamily protein PhnB
MIRPGSSFPVFIVLHLGEAKKFYEDHFSFNVAFENDWYLHLCTETGIQVGFLSPNQPTQPEMFHKTYDGSGVILSLEVEDVESAYSEAKEKKLDIVLDLRSEEWGQYHFCVRDPNGVILDVVQEIEPTEEYKEGYATE